jgi:hypothetical protein
MNEYHGNIVERRVHSWIDVWFELANVAKEESKTKDIYF